MTTTANHVSHEPNQVMLRLKGRVIRESQRIFSPSPSPSPSLSLPPSLSLSLSHTHTSSLLHVIQITHACTQDASLIREKGEEVSWVCPVKSCKVTFEYYHSNGAGLRLLVLESW